MTEVPNAMISPQYFCMIGLSEDYAQVGRADLS